MLPSKNNFVKKMYSMISENAISAIKTIFWDRYADATLTK